MLLDFRMRESGSKVRVAAVADRQWGRVKWEQLVDLGVPESTISRWISQGYLHPRLPRVYAVGHISISIEAQFAEALLYAGPGAMLSHGTAVWWLGLLKYPPREIHVGTPRRVRNHERIRVHGGRRVTRIEHRGLPVTSAETAIELTYLVQVSSWLAIQPDLQYVVTPNTTPTLPNAWAFQVRFEMSF